MTFTTAPWALDGARISSSLARLGLHAGVGGAEGIVNMGDLKVTPLGTPGNGIIIGAGGALIPNRYQTVVSESYAVMNVGTHTMGSADMPASNASARSHLVCVTIGDQQFSQVGHPWMPSVAIPAGDRETYQYVRPFILTNVPAGTASFAALNRAYPAIELARLDMPANTTTVQSAHIVDLRKLAQPRNIEHIQHIQATANNSLNGGGFVAGVYEAWPSGVNFPLFIPTWAVKAKVTAFVEGVSLTKAGQSRIRVGFVDGGATFITNVNESGSTGRRSYNIGGEIDIPAAYRGTTRTIRMEGTPVNDASKGMLTTDGGTSGQIRVRLEEQAT